MPPRWVNWFLLRNFLKLQAWLIVGSNIGRVRLGNSRLPELTGWVQERRLVVMRRADCENGFAELKNQCFPAVIFELAPFFVFRKPIFRKINLYCASNYITITLNNKWGTSQIKTNACFSHFSN